MSDMSKARPVAASESGDERVSNTGEARQNSATRCQSVFICGLFNLLN